jgi:hypothetical protein
MEATVTLSGQEACEAVRAYLVLRGALPKHGVVKKVKQSGDGRGYGEAKIEAEVEIGEEPVPAPNCDNAAQVPS